MLSPRRVMTADQCFSPILPISNHRGSSVVRAGISTNPGSAQSLWAVSKSMPCLRLLSALLSGSYSKPTSYQRSHINKVYLLYLRTSEVRQLWPAFRRLIRLARLGGLQTPTRLGSRAPTLLYASYTYTIRAWVRSSIAIRTPPTQPSSGSLLSRREGLLNDSLSLTIADDS